MQAKPLLEEWLFRIRRSQKAHYEAATYFERLNFWLGIPVIVLTTIVGSSVFISLQNDTNAYMKFIVGTASIVAAILAGLQTFLRFSERSEQHRMCALKYGSIRRELELKLTFPPDPIEPYLDDLRMRIDRFNDDSPTIPTAMWTKIDKHSKLGPSQRPAPSFNPDTKV